MSKILIVEDEESIADLEKDYLELSGFEVEVANDGQTGLDKALFGDFDLVILDLMLPGVDGFEICRKVRAEKNTPIIMVSAKKDDIDKIRGLGLGADDYMTKPFSPSELVARVKAHLARYERLIGSAVEENKVIERGELRMDPLRHAVSWKGRDVSLTVTEFLLLQALAQRPGFVKSRDQLMDVAYDDQVYVDDRTIDSHVKRMRKKFRAVDNEFDAIETLYGVGYRYRES